MGGHVRWCGCFQSATRTQNTSPGAETPGVAIAIPDPEPEGSCSMRSRSRCSMAGPVQVVWFYWLMARCKKVAICARVTGWLGQ